MLTGRSPELGGRPFLLPGLSLLSPKVRRGSQCILSTPKVSSLSKESLVASPMLGEGPPPTGAAGVRWREGMAELPAPETETSAPSWRPPRGARLGAWLAPAFPRA